MFDSAAVDENDDIRIRITEIQAILENNLYEDEDQEDALIKELFSLSLLLEQKEGEE